jgi:hypothetical protein
VESWDMMACTWLAIGPILCINVSSSEFRELIPYHMLLSGAGRYAQVPEDMDHDPELMIMKPLFLG